MTPKKPMPTWVADQLIAGGLMTADRITRTAKPRTCQDCHARTLTALDEITTKRVDLDPTPISALGEAVAILSGRGTYGIFYGELAQREGSEITHRPADARPVYATHACHSPPLPPEPQFAALTRATPTADDQPPF